MSPSITLRSELYLLNHPFYQAWMDGRLSLAALRDYACQYYHHVEAFPRYLQNAVELTTEGESQKILRENLAEEDGSAFGTSHPELWLQFAEGVGVSPVEVKSATYREGIQNVVETFTTCSRGSFPQALGCLYAYESQVPEIAHSKIAGLQRHFDIHDEKTLAFFEVHKTADIQHRESLLKVIEALPEEQKHEAQKAADKACESLWNFLSDVASVHGVVGV